MHAILERLVDPSQHKAQPLAAADDAHRQFASLSSQPPFETGTPIAQRFGQASLDGERLAIRQRHVAGSHVENPHDADAAVIDIRRPQISPRMSQSRTEQQRIRQQQHDRPAAEEAQVTQTPQIDRPPQIVLANIGVDFLKSTNHESRIAIGGVAGQLNRIDQTVVQCRHGGLDVPGDLSSVPSPHYRKHQPRYRRQPSAEHDHQQHHSPRSRRQCREALHARGE